MHIVHQYSITPPFLCIHNILMIGMPAKDMQAHVYISKC